MDKEIKVENTSITNDQVKFVYNELNKVESNSNNDKLEAAREQTDSVQYDSITPMDNNLGIPQDDMSEISQEEAEEIINKVEERDSDYREILKTYGIRDEKEITEFFMVLNAYKKNNSSADGLYNQLPPFIQTLCDNMVNLSNGYGSKLSKDNAAKNIIDGIINDAKLNKALDEFNEELNDVTINTSKEYKVLMNEYIENMYKDIDKIKAEDPEKAKIVEKLKEAFDNAGKFTKELEYLNHTTNKKLEKALMRYKNECFYFNRKVNSTDITLPDIDQLYPIIKRALPNYTEKQIKKFIVVICKASATYNFDNIDELAYTYRSIENILSFRAIDIADFESDFAKEVFGNVSVVINKIIDLEEV